MLSLGWDPVPQVIVTVTNKCVALTGDQMMGPCSTGTQQSRQHKHLLRLPLLSWESRSSEWLKVAPGTAVTEREIWELNPDNTESVVWSSLLCCHSFSFSQVI